MASVIDSYLPADATLLFMLLAALFGLLLWGKLRYDLVAFCALLLALVLGLVPKEEAFNGFGHPAVIIIALVLIVSRGLINSGAIGYITNFLVNPSRSLSTHIGIMAGLAASLSALMNNVGALALLMPVDIQASKKAVRSISLTLMPLSFATILGGLVTLIGTPPNIIISSYRETALGAPYAMFDFAWVGLGVAVVGVLFVAIFGWRLIPQRENKSAEKLSEAFEKYMVEVAVPAGAACIGKRVRDLIDGAERDDIIVHGLIRDGKRLPGGARIEVIEENDQLVIQGSAEDVNSYVARHKLNYSHQPSKQKLVTDGMVLTEVVVTENSKIIGRTSREMKLQYRFGVQLLGLSRPSESFRTQIRKTAFKPGDVLLLLGNSDEINDVINWMECLPLAARGLELIKYSKAGYAAGIFALAVLAASLNLIYLPVALGIVCACYVFLDIVPIRSMYENIEWPVIVLLGSLIPIATALETSGGTAIISDGLLSLANNFGLGPAVVLTLLLIVTMTLSDLLNNTATTVIAAPIALDIAQKMNVNPDGFLMAVAIGASCAFLTPIGHKNNTLIMGPGNYKFGDYWRLGLPLEILIVAVAVPLILIFWPL